MPLKKHLSVFVITLYIYYMTLLLGWRVVSFIYVYISMDNLVITANLEKVYKFDPYLTGIGILFTLLIDFMSRLSERDEIAGPVVLRPDLKLIYGYLIFLALNNFLFRFDAHLNVLELIVFLVSLWLLKVLGTFLYNPAIVGWHHPTTHGSIYVAALLIGCSLLDIFGFIILHESEVVYLVLVFLTFELIILYARFQYLSKHSQETNRLARNLMGGQILFFGTRIIVGIFMPMIFIIYSTFLHEKPVEGVAVLILLGTLLERYLFVITGSGTDLVSS